MYKMREVSSKRKKKKKKKTGVDRVDVRVVEKPDCKT